MPICCEELSYAVVMKVIIEGNSGPVMKVRDPDHGGSSFIPITFCPWCSKEFPRNAPTPPATLSRHP